MQAALLGLPVALRLLLMLALPVALPLLLLLLALPVALPPLLMLALPVALPLLLMLALPVALPLLLMLALPVALPLLLLLLLLRQTEPAQRPGRCFGCSCWVGGRWPELPARPAAGGSRKRPPADQQWVLLAG
jgi:hypothetical protein